MEVKRIGLDIAKNVFQAVGVDGSGKEVFSKRIRRAEVIDFFAEQRPCRVGIEACPSAHHWARELEKLGHTIALLPAAYVKSYVWGNKTDAKDAQAICRAMEDDRIRPIPVKTRDQQAHLSLHRAREFLVAERTKLSNKLRALLAEMGMVERQGQAGLQRLIAIACSPEDHNLPSAMSGSLRSLVATYEVLDAEVKKLHGEIRAHAKQDSTCRLLLTIPGIGPITASALAATIGDVSNFPNARRFAAWLGLTPKVDASGDKVRHGSISKRGDEYVRQLLVLGAQTVMRYQARHQPGTPGHDLWLARLRKRKHHNVAVVAQANKTARIVWAVLTYQQPYSATRRPRTPAI